MRFGSVMEFSARSVFSTVVVMVSFRRWQRVRESERELNEERESESKLNEERENNKN